jgi:hypothetical protein
MSRRGWLFVSFSWLCFTWLGHLRHEMVSSAQSVASPQPADGSVIPANVLAGFQERAFVGDNGSLSRYRVLLPKGFSESGVAKYPLVLFLHGACERGSDNAGRTTAGTDLHRTCRRRTRHLDRNLQA